MADHSQACFDVQTQRCVCPIGNRSARVRAAAPKLLAMLRKVEWLGCYEGHLGTCVPCCPICERPVNAAPGDLGRVHAEGCELGDLICYVDAPLVDE